VKQIEAYWVAPMDVRYWTREHTATWTRHATLGAAKVAVEAARHRGEHNPIAFLMTYDGDDTVMIIGTRAGNAEGKAWELESFHNCIHCGQPAVSHAPQLKCLYTATQYTCSPDYLRVIQ
jgi:hypothetical protein